MKLDGIVSDFDGTLTDKGMITEDFLSLLRSLQKAQLPFYILSGRSTAWGLFLLTHFPLTKVVMESGGVLLRKNAHGFIEKEFLMDPNDLDQFRGCREKMRSHFGEHLPWASDQEGRVTDCALELELLESNPALYHELKIWLSEATLSYTISNVHMNITLGSHTKWSGFLSLNLDANSSVYFGDSLNDEVMFQKHPHTVGVANIKSVWNKLQYFPKEVTLQSEIKGVKEYLLKHHILS
jgi:hydroxymethylpyrimidine pyrophosphatase-like HAD family hydrolase